MNRITITVTSDTSIRYNMVYSGLYECDETSMIHCRHVVTFLFDDCDKLRVRSVAAKRRDAINIFSIICCRLVFVHSVVKVDLPVLKLHFGFLNISYF